MITAMFALWMGATVDTVPAKPPCAMYDTCKYLPDYNGPLMPVWNTPGYYGGWTNGDVLCNPFTYSCRGVAVGQS